MPIVLDLEAIKPLIDTPTLIRDIERGFVLYSRGRVTVPPVGFLHFDDPPGDVHLKYGAVSGDDHYVVKLASAFHENPRLGLSVSDGLLLVFSARTGGLELVLLDECWLTDMRTAAAGAVAARYLAPEVVHGIGIVGTGVQARMQLEMLDEVVDCRRCLVWGRDPDKVTALIEEMEARESIERWGLEIEAAPSLEELGSRCDLIVTTTSSTAPLLRADMVRGGTHITAMGSDDHDKQELDAELLGVADVVVADSRTQCVDHGECRAAVEAGRIAEEAIVELGEVVADPSLGRTGADQITIADLTGVAIQDIQIAKMVARAVES